MWPTQRIPHQINQVAPTVYVTRSVYGVCSASHVREGWMLQLVGVGWRILAPSHVGHIIYQHRIRLSWFISSGKGSEGLLDLHEMRTIDLHLIPLHYGCMKSFAVIIHY